MRELSNSLITQVRREGGREGEGTDRIYYMNALAHSIAHLLSSLRPVAMSRESRSSRLSRRRKRPKPWSSSPLPSTSAPPLRRRTPPTRILLLLVRSYGFPCPRPFFSSVHNLVCVAFSPSRPACSPTSIQSALIILGGSRTVPYSLG